MNELQALAEELKTIGEDLIRVSTDENYKDNIDRIKFIIGNSIIEVKELKENLEEYSRIIAEQNKQLEDAINRALNEIKDLRAQTMAAQKDTKPND